MWAYYIHGKNGPQLQDINHSCSFVNALLGLSQFKSQRGLPQTTVVENKRLALGWGNTGRCCSTHHTVSIFFSDVMDMNARGRCSRRSLLGLAHPPVSASRLRPLGQRRIPLARFCTYPDPPRLQFSTTVPSSPHPILSPSMIHPPAVK